VAVRDRSQGGVHRWGWAGRLTWHGVSRSRGGGRGAAEMRQARAAHKGWQLRQAQNTQHSTGRQHTRRPGAARAAGRAARESGGQRGTTKSHVVRGAARMGCTQGVYQGYLGIGRRATRVEEEGGGCSRARVLL
jgi:hypothetical protein